MSQVVHKVHGPSGAQLTALARGLAAQVVKVGIPNNANQPKKYYDDEGREVESAELTLVEVATFNEFGTRDGRVPSRPFMAISAETGRPLLKKLAGRLWVSVMRGDRPVGDVLELLGQKHQSQIQATIAEGVSPENAPFTVERKGSSRTLISTGQLRQAITYAVVPLSEVKR